MVADESPEGWAEEHYSAGQQILGRSSKANNVVHNLNQDGGVVGPREIRNEELEAGDKFNFSPTDIHGGDLIKVGRFSTG